MKKLVAVAALLLAVVAPRTSSAGSTYRTFTDRAAYMASLFSGTTSFTPTPVDGSSAVGPIALTTSGACALPPSVFGGVIAFATQDDGSGATCPAGGAATLNFNTGAPGIVGFGVDLGSLGGDATVSALASFGGPGFTPESGNNPQTYTLLANANTQSFFGVILTPGFIGPQEISSVSVSVTSPNGLIGLDDVTYATFTPASTVPEPTTLVLLGGGLAAIGGLAARRRRSA